MSTILDNLLSRLHKVKRTGSDSYVACCPGHDDRSPSLSIRADGETVALYCFAGCSTEDVLASIGLTFSDLYAPREITYSDKGNRGRRVRREMRFPATDALRIIGREALIVCAGAVSVCADKPLSEIDRKRLVEAASRIQRALSASGVSYG